ncbi:catechol 2,3-dioxygenase-like lactoylglutathione lyase family enzyme [Knoellia remsis]|uniref:Catechol 2,3-dioxygenase-like lactoylglutathione lyase family enzyme n=1 Tax=Knoellia remsis TaxID=407159 RepID=A0A2T0UJN4_9MICO|nr:VOC family protein [Knoellia remsis]PRY58145.1 catechol 2,3-dioxygenase-like lactoylglutathione lyase family enzyme [Knoellia remsis]
MSADPARPPVRPVLDLVVLDCPDALALARFYGEVLGWELEEGSDRDWATLVPPGGGVAPERPDGRATLAFQRIDDWVPPTWPGGEHPQQFHLDFAVPVIADAEPAVLAAGATVHEHQPAESGGFKVYLDPAGHPFCLCRGMNS